MPEHQVTFHFSIGERVTIPALEDCVGIVETMTISQLGRDYRIAYWNQGKRNQEWLREDEIRPQ